MEGGPQVSYNYQSERPRLFTEEGQEMLLKVQDNVQRAFAVAGACRSIEATRGVAGCSWLQLACLDRLVEMKRIVEVTDSGTWGQYRIFTEPRRD